MEKDEEEEVEGEEEEVVREVIKRKTVYSYSLQAEQYTSRLLLLLA